ncbi:MAG: hypothetical protein O2923_04270 [Verrucomicrobia bacterium]|nr:hypothetical protein [Verrucomicrobiota bacterium]MDA1085624.1 hypothetical protein [Verrucomicrobiota bacterium]
MKPAAPPSHRARSIALVLTCLLSAGCTSERESIIASAQAEKPRVERAQRGPIEVTLTIEPAQVTLTRGLQLTIEASADGPTPPTLPPIQDRLSGFELVGQYDGEIVHSAGRSSLTRFFQLSPTLDREHRIAPMAIVLNGDWIATPPIVIPRVAMRDVPADITEGLKPRWIPPAFRTVAIGVIVVIALLVLAFLGWKLSKRVRRKIELARMSPRERALEELETLLALRLPEQQMVKEFYFELTMIVRRYIERAHHVRAPEQTTEEFLAAVRMDSRFGPAVIEKLTQFMDSADLVKYAAYQPDSAAVDGATRTSRDYIDTDADSATAAPSPTTQKPLATTHV